MGRRSGEQETLAITLAIFLNQHRRCAVGHQRAGGNSHRLGSAQRAGKGMAACALAHHLPRAGEIVGANSVAIHGRQIGGGLGAPGGEGGRQIAAEGLVHFQMFDRPLFGSKGQQPILRFFQREGGRHCAGRHHALSAARQCPDLPPVFSIRRTSSITMPLSSALAIS